MWWWRSSGPDGWPLTSTGSGWLTAMTTGCVGRSPRRVEFGIPIVPVLVDDTPLPAPDQAPVLTAGSRSNVLAGLRVRGRAFGVSIALAVALVGAAVAAFTVGRNSVIPSRSITNSSSSSTVAVTSMPGGTAGPLSLRLLYPDPDKVTDISIGITVKVKGQLAGHAIWTGYRATNESGKPTRTHTSLLWTNEADHDIWETMECFGLGNKPGTLYVVYAYLVPTETDRRWRLVDKKQTGLLQKTDYELERDGVTKIGNATVRLTADPQCHPAP